MSKVVGAFVAFACLVLAGAWIAPAWAAQNSSQSNDPTLTPPPAYTPPAPGAAPVEDTPAQRAALDKLEAKANQQFDSARKAYNTEVTATYNFHYGKDKPFTPGNIKVQGDGFLQPGAFPSAEYCGTCHQEAYAQWRQSLHSNSFRTPFYRTSVNLLIHDKARGPAYARHCDSCHNPIAVLSGALTEDSKIDRAAFDSDGITCTTCHSVQKVYSTNGNAGLEMGVPAVIVDEKGNRIPGEVPFDQILRHPERHSKAVMSSLLHTPEFCAACHKANLPEPLNDYKFIRAFTTYDEWQQSKFSQRNPLTFYPGDFSSCQGCHMKRVAVTLPEYGAKHGTFVSHRWLAGNTAVPFYYGFDEQLKKTIEFLRSGNYLNVDIFAIKNVAGGAMTAPLGSTPLSLKAGETVETSVVIQSKNIGHSLIPEVRDLYEAWVRVNVKDASGTLIYHSGFLEPDGILDRGAHSFTNRPVDLTGNFVENHKVWTIHSVAYDNTIQSGRSALVRYQFQIPTNAKSPITIAAAVEYRHLRQSYLNNVLGNDHPSYPVVELASQTRTLNLGDNPPIAPEPNDNPDWMRWNNIGIGYLDSLQYEDAIHAFDQVIKLRPDYKDGYINLGLTYIEWEKYTDAREPLEEALTIHPDDARALYYLALVERRQRHSEAEVADLEKVVAQYPQSRDARRELGISYYQQHRSAEAMEQFKALQAIDPDDLAAHYNLSILYRRMGMKKQAAEQAAQYVTKRIDPGAPTYSLDYLRKHPEQSTESDPWHVHSDRSHASSTAQGPQ
ncbi:MAG TPA: tetratricopeptide repeat protein [Terracidiphilus sp.]|jgi:tetratricopeptide (TPR) repeat protein/cytochrome c1